MWQQVARGNIKQNKLHSPDGTASALQAHCTANTIPHCTANTTPCFYAIVAFSRQGSCICYTVRSCINCYSEELYWLYSEELHLLYSEELYLLYIRLTCCSGWTARLHQKLQVLSPIPIQPTDLSGYREELTVSPMSAREIAAS